MGKDWKMRIRENHLLASGLGNARIEWKSTGIQVRDNGIEEVVGSIPSGSTTYRPNHPGFQR
jgi:hypothetical protein